ncbi:MAG: protein kinase, partial [Ardenticatenia bacterium]|nr:protein kinase [Ardenticatenia bacterium]
MKTLPKGSTIGPYPYRLIRPIGKGKGGMAVVYLATVGDDVDAPDPMDLVAIKFSLVHKQTEHRAFFARAHSNEVEILRHLDHPGVVRLYRIRGAGVGTRPIYAARAEVPGQPWFSVLEYLRGGSLDDLIKSQKQCDLEWILYVAHTIAKALAYVHGNGYVHLDLKPDNVLFRRPLDQAVEPVLVDFGVARPIGRVGLEGGTLQWLPPERVHHMMVDQPAPTHVLPHPSMDVYALGLILYTMLTGQPPFNARRPKSLIKAIVEQTPRPLSEVRPEVPAELNDLVMAMVAKAPDDRPTDEEVIATLRKLAPRQPPALLSQSQDQRLTAMPTPRAKTKRRPQKRHLPKWVAGLTAASLAILAAGMITMWAFQAGFVRVRTRADMTSVAQSLQNETLPPANDTAPPPSSTPEPTIGPTSTPVPVGAIVVARPSATPTSNPTPTSTATPTPTSTATSSPTPSGPPNTIDFETMGVWKRGDQPYGTLVQSANRARQGTYSGQLAYAFPSRDNDFVVFLQERPLEGRPNAVRAWVYGDGRGHFFNIWIRDSAGQVWQVPLGQVDHAGWQEMIGRIDVNQEWPWTHISGPDNGRVDYPIRFAGLVLDDYPDTFQGTGTIYIDEIRAVELSPEELAQMVEFKATPFPSPPSGETPSGAPQSGELTPTSQVTTAPSAPPLTGYLAFTLVDPATGAPSVYVSTPDGQQRWRVATYARQPAISNDRRVAVNGQGGGRDTIWIYNLDGSLPVQVGTHPEDAFPSWSPTSNRLVMSSTLHGDKRSRIYMYTNFTPQTDPELFMYGSYEMFGRYPTWFDNWQIAFNGCNYWDTGSLCGLYVLDSTGGLPRYLVGTEANDLAADYYGDQVVFMSPRTGNWDVFVVPFAGGTPRNLTNHPANDGLPTWSPDGRWVAFLSDREGHWAIWAVRPDGSGLRKLFDLN